MEQWEEIVSAAEERLEAIRKAAPNDTQILTTNENARLNDALGERSFKTVGLKYIGMCFRKTKEHGTQILRYYTIIDHKLWCFWRLRAGI